MKTAGVCVDNVSDRVKYKFKTLVADSGYLGLKFWVNKKIYKGCP